MGFPSESKKGDCQDITYFQSGIQFYKWGFPLKVRKEIVRIKHIFSRGHTILHSGGYILQTTYTVPLNADFNKKKPEKLERAGSTVGTIILCNMKTTF